MNRLVVRSVVLLLSVINTAFATDIDTVRTHVSENFSHIKSFWIRSHTLNPMLNPKRDGTPWALDTKQRVPMRLLA